MGEAGACLVPPSFSGIVAVAFTLGTDWICVPGTPPIRWRPIIRWYWPHVRGRQSFGLATIVGLLALPWYALVASILATGYSSAPTPSLQTPTSIRCYRVNGGSIHMRARPHR